MKQAQKDKIIFYILSNRDNKEILELIKNFANFYSIELKIRRGNYDLIKVLFDFIKNDHGYIELLPVLYNCILTNDKKIKIETF